MTVAHRLQPSWPAAVRRYLTASVVLHLAWEVIQLPLFTIWSEPPRVQAFAVLHCTGGDLMIAGLTLLAALALADRPDWPRSGGPVIWLLLLLFGMGYTIFSEWLNVHVRRSWAYSAAMPTLPILGTGLAPLLQWGVAPTLALWIACRVPPWRAGIGHGPTNDT